MNKLTLLKTLTAAAFAILTVSPLAGQTFCATPSTPAQPRPSQKSPETCDVCEENCRRSPCYLASGTYVTDGLDISIRTHSYPIQSARHYDSSGLVDGPLGIGWTSSLMPRLYYATYLFAAPNTYQRVAVVVLPDNTESTFRTNTDGSFMTPLGRFDTLVRNANGSFTLTLGMGTLIQFDSTGALTSIVDPYGHQINYTYDAAGRIQRIADASGTGRFVDVTWDTASGHISMVTDSAGRHVKYDYGADGTLASVSNPVASELSDKSAYFTYTTTRLGIALSRIADRWQRTISKLEWDSLGRLHSYTNGDFNDADPSSSTGEKYTYAYHPEASPPFATKTDSYHSVSYPYASDWLVNEGTPLTANGLPTTSPSGTAMFAFNSAGQVVSITRTINQQSVTWRYTYDTNFPTRVSEVIPYDNNSLRSTRWPGFRYEYFPTLPGGRLSAIKRYRTDNTTLDTLVYYSRDSAGRIISVTDAAVHQTLVSYDAAGEIATITHGNSTVSYSYDSLGRVVRRTDTAGHDMLLTWDANDRMTSVTYPPPSTTSNLVFRKTTSYDHYDAATGLTFAYMTDFNGRVTKEGYDALSHLCQSIDAMNGVTTLTYRANRMKSISDANGNTTTYAYAPEGYVNAVTYADGTTEQYGTNSTGEVSVYIDRRGIVNSYTYDEVGRPASVQHGSSIAITYTYDGARLAQVSDGNQAPASIYTFTYDSAFRLISQKRTGGETINFTYSPGGYTSLLAGYSVQPPQGSTEPSSIVSYTYDTARRVSAIDWSAVGGSFTFAYDAFDRYTSITFPNGQQRTFQYDDLGRLKQVGNYNPAVGELATFMYGYDFNWSTNDYTMLGKRTSVTVSAPPAAGQMNGMAKYSYDANGRLVRADYPSTWQAWTYDAIGNRLTQSDPQATTQYTYYKFGSNTNNGQRLRTPGANQPDYTYDQNGNVTGVTGGTWYTWDAANRLSSVLGTSITYDFRGQHYSQTAGGGTTRFINVGLHTVGQRFGGGGIDYLLGPGLDEPLAERAPDGTISYYGIDGSNSIVLLTGANGSINGSSSYSPWGERTGTSAQSLFAYTGREAVGSSGLMNNRLRYYQPSTGRFISEDPLQRSLPIAVAQQYGYVGNAPLDFDDPFGLWCRSRTLYGNREIYMEGIGYTSWRMVDEPPDPQHHIEPDEPKETEHIIESNGTMEAAEDMASAGGYKNASDATGRGANYGPVPAWGELCVWRRWMFSTYYWRQKISTETRCTCPPSVSIQPAGYRKGVDTYYEYQTMKQETTTSYSTVLGKWLQLECRPPDYVPDWAPKW
jgi:RHS repeat-associated protein